MKKQLYRHPKQNWFESPKIKTDGRNFFHNDQKIDLFNVMKNTIYERPTYLNPNNNSIQNSFLWNVNHIKQGNKNAERIYNQFYNNQNNNLLTGNNNSLSNYNNSNNINIFNNQINGYSHANKFQDANLPDMFNNVKIQIEVQKQFKFKFQQKQKQKPKLLIEKKLNFDESSIIIQEERYITPKHKPKSIDLSYYKHNKQLPTTVKKQSNYMIFKQQKKPRPKEKGLQILSQKAYQIVLQSNGATYKSVSTCLVQQLAIQQGVMLKGKDQKNIKRRAYDALNILIASGVLKKNQRKIYGVSLQKNQQQKTIKMSLIQKINFKKMILKDKQIELQKCKINQQTIKALIKRNHYNQISDKQCFKFPFLAFTVPDLNQNTIKFKESKQKLQINQNQNQKIQPFGDIDAVMYLQDILKKSTQ